MEKIKLHFRSCDGWRKTSTFKTLAGAQRAAQKALGRYADLGTSYAVSGDGITTLTCEGCRLADLFPASY